MAALTWREVAAPSFYSSMEGFRTFGNLIDNAFRGATTAVDGLQAAQTQHANNAAMLESLKYSDPTEYQRALAAGNITGAAGDPSKISTRTIQDLSGRTATLLDQTKGLADFNYQQDGRQQMAQAAPQISDYLTAAASGNPAKATEALASIKGLRPDLLSHLVQNGGNAAQTSIGNQQARVNLDNGQSDRATNQAAEVLRNTLGQIGTEAGQQLYLQAHPEIPELVRVRAMNGMAGGGMGGGAAGGGGR